MFGGILPIVLEEFLIYKKKSYDGHSEVCFLGIAFRKTLRRRRRAGESTWSSKCVQAHLNAPSRGSMKWRWLDSCVEKDHLQYFNRRVSVEEQRVQKFNRFLRVRQIPYLIYGQLQSTGAYDAAQGLSDCICLHDEDVKDFDASWDQSLLGTT